MISSIRGMRDILPVDARRWSFVEDTLARCMRQYAYEEVQLPLLEETALFARGVGEATDIVEKEMYTLTDRDGLPMSLRPEGTASCVRALLEHGLLFNQTQRVFYRGPMFRYERPQRGRYRQFSQLGAEAFGMQGPDVDAELIQIGQAFWQALGVADAVQLELNTLGSGDARKRYRAALVAYLTPYAADLDEDSRRRLETNPLRILDSKDAGTRQVLADAPQLPDFVDDEAKAHFDTLCMLLDAQGVACHINPTLVRGLDYYTHTVFEWTTDQLGSQGTVCGGGRYDGLVERLGGRPTPAAGFGAGLDRIVLLHEVVQQAAGDNEGFEAAADVYICIQSAELNAAAFELAKALRNAPALAPGLRVRVHMGGGKLKNQFKRADQSGARWTVVVAPDELAQGRYVLKPMRSNDAQITASLEELVARLHADCAT